MGISEMDNVTSLYAIMKEFNERMSFIADAFALLPSHH